MEPVHARLLCRLARDARERGLEVWASRDVRQAFQRLCRPAPTLLSDADLEHRARGLLRQLAHVGMLWLEGERVVCRVESASTGPPASRFPGPAQVRCLVIVDTHDQGNPLRRDGWSVITRHHLARYFRRQPAPAPLSRPAREGQAEVIALEPRGGDAYRMTLGCVFPAEAARAGQFMLLECTPAAERAALRRARNRPRQDAALTADPKAPLLRRPFGFHRFSGPDYLPDRLREPPPFPPALAHIVEPGRGETFEVLFKVVGRGTQRLAAMSPGERLSIRAPLGRPVEIRPDLDCAILVAGGIGAGPLFALAQELRRRGIAVRAALGAVVAAAAPVAPSEFEAIGASAALVTEQEDGLLVTHYLERELPHLVGRAAGGRGRGARPAVEVFACGPTAMLAEVARIALPALPVQVLMEQRMACGMGVCRGCVVRMRADSQPGATAPPEVYRTVCREGPAFRAEEVAWQELAATVG